MDAVDTNTAEEVAKYMIPLDGIDFNVIPTSFNRRFGKDITHIWRKENLDLRNSEYYEFEIKQKDSKHMSGMNNEKEYTYVPCHVCHIEIPKEFLQDHFNSKKHKTYKKIINTSMDRLKKAAMADIVVIDKSDINDYVYFCNCCDIVVNNKEKKLHEKSIMHKRFLVADNILNDFLNIYDNGNQVFDEENNIEDTQDIKPTYDNISEINDYKTDKVNSIKTTDSDVTVRCNNVAAQTNYYSNIFRGGECLEDYINFLKDTTSLKNIKIVDDCFLEIITLSGIRLKIFELYFHGFKKDTDSSYQCILCSTYVHKRQRWSHLYEKKHLDRVTVPLENDNCIRKIDEVWSYCVLCNTLTRDRDEHIVVDEDHKLAKNKAIINEKTMTCKENVNIQTAPSINCNEDLEIKERITNKNSAVTKQIFCSVCEIDVSCDYQTHTKSKRHKIEEKIKISKVHYFMTVLSSKHLYCKICKINLENNVITAKQHLINSEHVDNYKKMLTLNKIIEFEEYYFECTSCKVCFVKMNELMHIQSKCHRTNCGTQAIKTKQTNIEMITLKDYTNVITNLTFKCTLCKIQIPKNNFNIYDHLLSKKHLEAVKFLNNDKKFKIPYHFGLTQLPKLYCMVCNVHMEFNEDNIIKHTEEDNHKQKYNELLEKNQLIIKDNAFFCNICFEGINNLLEIIHCKSVKHNHLKEKNVNDDTKVNSNPIKEIVKVDIKHYLLKDIGKANEVHCLVCDVKVPNKVGNLSSHLNGRTHKMLYESTLKMNNIVKVCYDYFCQVCNKICITGEELKHISSEMHKDKLKDVQVKVEN